MKNEDLRVSRRLECLSATVSTPPRAAGAFLCHPRLRLGAAAVLVAAAAVLGATQAQAQMPPAQTANGIEYVTGGFGENMADAFKAAESDYPLALTFAATEEGGGSRPYVADVHVVVKGEGGATVLDVPSAGPYLLARLKPGRYAIEATYQGDTQTRNVVVKEGGTVRDVLTWKR